MRDGPFEITFGVFLFARCLAEVASGLFVGAADVFVSLFGLAHVMFETRGEVRRRFKRFLGGGAPGFGFERLGFELLYFHAASFWQTFSNAAGIAKIPVFAVRRSKRKWPFLTKCFPIVTMTPGNNRAGAYQRSGVGRKPAASARAALRVSFWRF